MKKVNCIYFIIMISVLSGCAGFKEEAKLLWGSSTKALEEERREALQETFACSWEQCFSAVINYTNGETLLLADEKNDDFLNARPSKDTELKAVAPTSLEVFLQDRDRKIIVVMGVPGSVPTTEVAVFFTPNDNAQTLVEITSLSTLAKIRASDILFSYLGQKFQKIN